MNNIRITFYTHIDEKDYSVDELLYAGLCLITAGAEPGGMPLDQVQDNQTNRQIVSEAKPPER